MIWTVAIQESRAIVDVQVCRAFPEQRDIDTSGKCFTLIVVQEAENVARVTADQPSSHNSRPLRVLMRVREMNLCAIADARRLGRRFPATNPRMAER